MRVDSDVIIAASSVVTKDIQSNSVVAGVPAEVIESLDEYLAKISKRKRYPSEIAPVRQEVLHELADYLWDEFLKERE